MSHAFIDGVLTYQDPAAAEFVNDRVTTDRHVSRDALDKHFGQIVQVFLVSGSAGFCAWVLALIRRLTGHDFDGFELVLVSLLTDAHFEHGADRASAPCCIDDNLVTRTGDPVRRGTSIPADIGDNSFFAASLVNHLSQFVNAFRLTAWRVDVQQNGLNAWVIQGLGKVLGQ